MSYLKSIWEYYITLSLPARLFLLGLSSGVLGSGIVGFLSEYAAYTYAIYYGIRPPFEGIPFLRVAVSTITFLVFAGGASVFLFAITILHMLIFRVRGGGLQSWVMRSQLYVARIFLKALETFSTRMGFTDFARGLTNHELYLASESDIDDLIDRLLKKRSFRNIFLSAALIGFAVGLVFFISFLTQGRSTFGVEEITASSIIGVLVFTAILVTWRPNLVRILATYATILFVFFGPTVLFHPPTYAGLLRIMGYGGGLLIEAKALDTRGSFIRTINGHLVLRTTSALIFYDNNSGTIHELPLSSVASLEYHARALFDQDWKLPE